MIGDQNLAFAIAATLGDIRTIDAAIVDLLAMSGVDESTTYNVQLAAHEVCTNIVEHAYAGRNDGTIAVKIRLIRSAPAVLTIELRDNGQPFDFDATPEPDLDELHEGGYGLFLVRALLDEVRYEHDAGENVWTLTKRL